MALMKSFLDNVKQFYKERGVVVYNTQYPEVPLAIRLRSLQGDKVSVVTDFKKEFALDREKFMLSFFNVYYRTNYDSANFFSGVPENVLAVIIVTMQNIRNLFDIKPTYIHSVGDKVYDELYPDQLVVGGIYDVDSYDVKHSAVMEYLIDLNCARAVPIMSQDYSDFKLQYSAYAHRLPLMLEIISQLDPKLVIASPGDGIGVVAIACHMLGRQSLTSEPNDIGDRARRIGLIDYKMDAKEFFQFIPSNAVVIISNIARYTSFDYYIDKYNVIVVDELCFYPGWHKLIEIPYTNGRIRVSLSYDFVRTVCSFSDNIPNCDGILDKEEKYQTDDPRAYNYMVKNDYLISSTKGSDLASLVPSGDGKVIKFNYMGVKEVDDFILSYRKYAGARSGKKGQYQLLGDFMHRYSECERIVFTQDGYKVVADAAYVRSNVLLGYVITFEMLEYQFPIDPSRFKMSFQFGLFVPIMIANVRREGRNYYALVVRKSEDQINGVGKVKKK